jgi:hypothetical protein
MEARMHDLSFVMQRIAAVDRARFFHAYFAQQGVELSRGLDPQTQDSGDLAS